MSVTPVIGDTTAKLVISLTSGQAKTITFSSDVDLPDGTYTLTVAGADAGTVPLTQDDARTLRAVFPADNAALIWQQWRLRLDGIDFAGGPIIETQPNNPAGDSTEPLTVNLGDNVVQLTVTITGGGGGEVTADSVTTDAWTGRLSGLDQNVGAVLDMIDAGLDDHYVALFVTDDDYSGGTLTAATLYDSGTQVPRAYLVGVQVCVVSGDDMGLWVITESGPCTPGRTIDPGDVIRAFSQGFTATAGSTNGVDVSGINVAATYETVRGLSDTVETLSSGQAALAGTVDELLAKVGNPVRMPAGAFLGLAAAGGDATVPAGTSLVYLTFVDGDPDVELTFTAAAAGLAYEVLVTLVNNDPANDHTVTIAGSTFAIDVSRQTLVRVLRDHSTTLADYVLTTAT